MLFFRVPQREHIATVNTRYYLYTEEMDFPVTTERSLQSMMKMNILLTSEDGSSVMAHDKRHRYCCQIEPATKEEFDDLSIYDRSLIFWDAHAGASCEFRGYEDKLKLLFKELPYHSSLSKLNMKFNLPDVGPHFDSGYTRFGTSNKGLKKEFRDAIRNSTIKLYRSGFPAQGCPEDID